MSYPACDFCGTCLHCPEHGPDCAHPCQGCGVLWYFDQPVCVNIACPTYDEGYVWRYRPVAEQLCLLCWRSPGIDEENSDPGSGPSEYSMGEPPWLEPCICQY